MKGRTYLFSYLSALVIGILLLVFHESSGLFEGVVIAMGILIIIPSAIMLIAGFLRKVTTASKWYGVIASVAGLVFGIWMLCMPSFFINASIYTLGILLILAGVAGILFVINAARPASVNYLWMIVPVLAVAGDDAEGRGACVGHRADRLRRQRLCLSCTRGEGSPHCGQRSES